jgi:hypothetical protein
MATGVTRPENDYFYYKNYKQMKCQNKNFFMRNNSIYGNSLYLGIFYHFKTKTQKKIFDKKIR